MTFHGARDICLRLKGHYDARVGHGMARCPAHDDRSPSLSVQRAPDGRPLVHCHAGCSQRDVIDALKRLGLWGNGEPVPDSGYVSDPFVGTQNRHEKRGRALVIWDTKTRPATGTAVEAYLRARGIDLRISDELRYAPALPYHAPNESRRLSKSYPCMVARISDDLGFCGIQRTFLDPAAPKKAAVEMPKKTLGTMGEGAVRLRMPMGEDLGLAEGIETALSASQLYSVPVWATLSAKRFPLIQIPRSVKYLTIFADRPKANSPRDDSWECVEKAVDRFERAGLRVEIITPGADFDKGAKDFNTILQERRM